MLAFLKKQAEPISTPISPQQTNAIVTDILGIYHQKGSKMHFLFEHELISLKQFLLTIIPTVAELHWTFDKEEIGRAWNFLYVLHTVVTKVGCEFGMDHGTALGTSEEVILHPSFMADVIAKKDGRKVPLPYTHGFNEQACTQLASTHELRLTAFKNFWFLDSHPFLKRLRVVRDARIVTFFIAVKTLGHGHFRFSITCLPHAHLNAFDVHNRKTGFQGGCHTAKAKRVLKTRPTENMQAPELTALVWNITKTNPTTMAKNFYYLVTREEPTMFMLLGALGDKVIKMASALGFKNITSKSE